ncbi:MAG: hypothetical protein DRQ02_09460 [Candidatus Latescibacterota bacterium]|nr:MAG: hypothetical protein DRQ02_09460 [Candidatus Latescibacterota bacterium]
MSIAEISENKIILPKEIKISAKKLLVTSVGDYLFMIPIPEETIFLRLHTDLNYLRKLGENETKKDALSRYFNHIGRIL